MRPRLLLNSGLKLISKTTNLCQHQLREQTSWNNTLLRRYSSAIFCFCSLENNVQCGMQQRAIWVCLYRCRIREHWIWKAVFLGPCFSGVCVARVAQMRWNVTKDNLRWISATQFSAHVIVVVFVLCRRASKEVFQIKRSQCQSDVALCWTCFLALHFLL